MTIRCGFVALIGRPNVGKSTLLNRLLAEKISITSKKPQTTRHRILGIKTEGEVQTIYVDTPGLHKSAKRVMNRYMNRTATTVLHDVDVILFMIEAGKWTDEEEWILEKLKTITKPVLLLLNKVDQIKDKSSLLPQLEGLQKKFAFSDIMPISAEKGTNVAKLEEIIAGYLPEQPHCFPDDQITDRSERFLAAEMIREKLIRLTGQELPYSTTVEIESYQETPKLIRISAVIWVERDGQKAIIIGEEGGVLKKIGTRARLDLEAMHAKKVFLQLWVKVRKGWSDDEKALQSLGYGKD